MSWELRGKSDESESRFERDMTPHPQYVAFYKYIENDTRLEGPVKVYSWENMGNITEYNL